MRRTQLSIGEPRGTANATSRDRGVTFVELLVSIVLLGTVGIAVLTTLRVTITGTQLQRDHSRALQWLESAAAVVQGTNRESCILDPVLDAGYASEEEKVRSKYEHAIRTQVDNPPGWDADQLRIVPPVKLWDGVQFLDPAESERACSEHENENKRLQLITIEVRDTAGQIVETIDIVKSEGGEAAP